MRPDRPTNAWPPAPTGRIEAQRPLPEEYEEETEAWERQPAGRCEPGERSDPGERKAPKPPRAPRARKPKPAGTPSRRRKAWKRVGVGVVVVLVAQFLSVVSYNWFTPPRTSFMLQTGEPTVYQYVSIDHISRFALAATIAHEDEQLGTRVGAFTWDELTQRAQAWSKGEKDPSGSTIPQQLVKNIYLWPDQDPFRKGLEAGLSTEMSLTVPSKRVLELYLNYAQFAPKLYGICAASWYYFDTPPWAMTEHQAGQLMGVLPLPERVRRNPNGGIDLGPAADPLAWDLINGAANVWVPRQIEGMGGWQATVATVGITDTANDHAAQRSNTDACSTMPDAVAKRIASETGH
ncbi:MULTISPECIES: transglycosylase domain-containing protein [Arthrobacter]|uniref:Transglycosylase domain-containing protein n=2 Tax=Arthrobacter TaxID=1663 RepID=A0ABU9KGX1_9MICC|nr:transglycosylase domain-containing protein [Arthrobacter sp. YJM1]MDP5226133.1 transglycosylase domain-containing protein [Arthrobacter sp. YJM1]